MNREQKKSLNSNSEALIWREVASPIGPLLLVGSRDGTLHQLGLPEGKLRLEPDAEWTRDDDAFEPVVRQLNEYFAGRRQSFDIALQPEGTEFQKRVWSALREIPYGATISYAELADRIGKPTASRAVGAANGRNPLPIVVPCHRVIGADGSLTGFGGGLAAKEHLLRLEGVAVAPSQSSLLAS